MSQNFFGEITIEYSRLDALSFYNNDLAKYCFVSDKFKCRRKTNVCKEITAKTYWWKQCAAREKLIRIKKTIWLSKLLLSDLWTTRQTSRGWKTSKWISFTFSLYSQRMKDIRRVKLSKAVIKLISKNNNTPADSQNRHLPLRLGSKSSILSWN